MTVMYGGVLNYVNAAGVHWAHMVPADNRGILRVPVTVPVTGGVTQLMGDMEPKEYGARAAAGFRFRRDRHGDRRGRRGLEQRSGRGKRRLRMQLQAHRGRRGKENINGSVSPIAENGTYEIGMRFQPARFDGAHHPASSAQNQRCGCGRKRGYRAEINRRAA